MAFVELAAPTGGTTPASGTDYQRQNALIAAAFLGQEKVQPFDLANNKIPKGVIVNIGGTIYLNDADLSITGTPSTFVKIDHSTLAASYVASLSGVTWSSVYNGYYDGSSDYYLFDEMEALFNGDIAVSKTINGLVKLAAQSIDLGGNLRLIPKIIEIGDWDMDTTGSINIAHGLTYNSLKYSADALIRSDSDSLRRPLNGLDGEVLIGPTNIGLTRYLGGYFDDPSFNSTSYNRGWVTIWYEA